MWYVKYQAEPLRNRKKYIQICPGCFGFVPTRRKRLVPITCVEGAGPGSTYTYPGHFIQCIVETSHHDDNRLDQLTGPGVLGKGNSRRD